MKLSIEVTAESTNTEVDFAIETLKKFKNPEPMDEGPVSKHDEAILELRENDVDRFQAKFEEGEEDKCWNWEASTNNGYGRFTIYPGNGDKIHLRANRVAFFLANDRLPVGGLVCHSCDNPRCVNPKHLFEGTNKMNSDDKISKGRGNWARGEKAGGAKLTNQQVVEILQRLAAGETQSAIARDYGVWQTAISKISLGQRRKHSVPNGGVPFTPKVEQQVAPVAKTSAPKAVLPSPQVEAKPAPVAPMQPVYVQPTVVPAMPAVPQVAPPMFKSPTGRIEHAVTNLSAPVSPGQAPDMFSPSNMALLAERKVQAERTASAQQAHTAPPFSPVVAPEQQMSQPAPTPVFQIANPNQVVAFSPPTFR